MGSARSSGFFRRDSFSRRFPLCCTANRCPQREAPRQLRRQMENGKAYRPGTGERPLPRIPRVRSPDRRITGFRPESAPLVGAAGTERWIVPIPRRQAYAGDPDGPRQEAEGQGVAVFRHPSGESDYDGSTLRSVVALQDSLLALGVAGVEDWLKAAERP